MSTTSEALAVFNTYRTECATWVGMAPWCYREFVFHDDHAACGARIPPQRSWTLLCTRDRSEDAPKARYAVVKLLSKVAGVEMVAGWT